MLALALFKFWYCSRHSLSLPFTLLPLLTKNVFHLDLYYLIMYGPKNGRATIRLTPVSDESRVLDTVTEASNRRAIAQALYRARPGRPQHIIAKEPLTEAR